MRALFVFLLVATTALAAIDGIDSTNTMGSDADDHSESPVQEKSLFWNLNTGDVEQVPIRRVCHETEFRLFWCAFLLTTAVLMTFFITKVANVLQELRVLRLENAELREGIFPVLVIKSSKHRSGTSCGVPQ